MNFCSMIAAHNERHFVQQPVHDAMAAFGTYRHYNWNSDTPPPVADMLAALADTDVLLTGWGTPPLPLALLDNPDRRLRYVCNLTGGMRPFLPRAYLEAGITVTNWGDGPMWYLAEGTLALMLACSREMSRVAAHMRTQPQWTFPFRSPRPTLRRKTVGFLGFGAIARILHGLLGPLECRALIYDPYQETLPQGCRRAETLEALFDEAEVLVIFCGLTPETTGLVHRGLLDRLKPHSIFINTARGRIIVEEDLIAFLRARPDVSAGLDVFAREPLPKDSPLLDLDNVIAYPHSVGGGGEDMYRTAAEYAADNLRAFCEGRPLKAVVTPAAYDRMT